MKESVIVFFGGKSAEHDISIITGLQAIKAINKEKYNVLPIYISRENKWYMGESLDNIKSYIDFDKTVSSLKEVALKTGEPRLLLKKKKKFIEFEKVDCALICCHGLSGEDGTLQGVLELSDIPYTSSDHVSSALCMDKIVMKYIFKSIGLPTVDFTWFLRNDYYLNSDSVMDQIEKELGYPVMIKPSNLGSSIGISRCNSREELEDAIETAIQYDSRILAEKAVNKFKEINCSVLGNSVRSAPSTLEQPASWQDFLTFEEKYISGGAQRKIGIKLPAKIESSIKNISLKAFKEFCCSGVVRIDFLYDTEAKQVYINEINSIPGSLAFYLWTPSGLSYTKLIDTLISLAKEQKREKGKSTFSYNSQALINFGKTAGKGKFPQKGKEL